MGLGKEALGEEALEHVVYKWIGNRESRGEQPGWRVSERWVRKNSGDVRAENKLNYIWRSQNKPFITLEVHVKT